MPKSSQLAIMSSLVAAFMLTACGGVDQDSSLDNSNKKKYQLWCLANLNYPGAAGINSRTVRAQGTKEYKMDNVKLVDSKKEKDEYKAVLTNLATACNGLYSIINVSGCSNIRWDKPELLVQDSKTPFQSNFIAFEYTGRFNGVDQKIKGEYFCQMREVATTP